jgi:hypothetical protein
MGSAGKSLKAEAKAFAVWFWFEAIRRGLCLNYMKMSQDTNSQNIEVLHFCDIFQ